MDGRGDSVSRYFSDYTIRFEYDSRDSTWRPTANHAAPSELDRVPLLPSLGPSDRLGGVRLEVCNSGVSVQDRAVVSGSAADHRRCLDDSVSAEAQVNQDQLFRAALLILLIAGLSLTAWHISWLHKQPRSRYEMQSGDYGRIYILDRQERVVYAGRGGLAEEPIAWHTSPLPK